MTLLAPPKTILVVDDCESICELIEILLVRAGYHVRTATRGSEALRLAGSGGEIDLLLVNLNMPAMPGDELAARLVQSHPETAVVFLTGSEHPTVESSPHEVLLKPFTIAQLRDTVRRALLPRPPLAEAGRLPAAA